MTDTQTLIITGSPNWIDSLTIPAGYHVQHYTDDAGYVARLVDDVAVFILVDGTHSHWERWTSAPKSSPATRRVPVFVVTSDAGRQGEALTAGADGVVSPIDLPDALPDLLAEHAPPPDPDRQAALDCDCAEPLPPLAVEGVAKFNAGEFYKQHDLFEELWMETESPVRDLYRAILQVGVAYYQIERGNYRGARKMILRALPWLNALPDSCQTVDVAALREDAEAVRVALAAIDAKSIANFDRSLLKPVRLISS